MLDIIIPCRNAPNVLSLALTHLWAYGLPTGLIRSVTLLDNRSTDPAMDTLLAYVATRPLHTVVRHEENVGVWCSVNRGLQIARSDLVMVLTSDVLIGPHLLPALIGAHQQTGLAFIGPDNGTLGLAGHGRIFLPLDPVTRLEPDYNGACWLMHWSRLRTEVGYYDPRFYICAGDVDYIERLRARAAEIGDARLLPHCIRGLHICHLDKQSRRHDATATGDATMELHDLGRFNQKWRATRPDICHPMPSLAGQLAYKAEQLGGWKAAKIG